MTKPMEVNVLFLLKILCREIDQENKHLCPGRLWVLPGYIFAAASGGVSSGAIFEKTTFFLEDSAGAVELAFGCVHNTLDADATEAAKSKPEFLFCRSNSWSLVDLVSPIPAIRSGLSFNGFSQRGCPERDRCSLAEHRLSFLAGYYTLGPVRLSQMLPGQPCSQLSYRLVELAVSCLRHINPSNCCDQIYSSFVQIYVVSVLLSLILPLMFITDLLTPLTLPFVSDSDNPTTDSATITPLLSANRSISRRSRITLCVQSSHNACSAKAPPPNLRSLELRASHLSRLGCRSPH